MTRTRPTWDSLPEHIRASVGELLGSEVVTAVSQPGGFSPGTADRVVTADGRRAFVKVTGLPLNDRSVEFHRREAEITAGLTSSAIPTLIGSVDTGDWVALVYEEIDGSAPELPWRADDLRAVLDACHAVAALAVEGLEDKQPAVAAMRAHWDAVIDVGSISPWAADRVSGLRALAALADVTGDALVHQDLRADNVLMRPDGTAVIVDWPWAGRGASWLDPVTLLYNVRLYDPDADVERWLSHPAFGGSTAESVDALLAALAGFFLAHGQRPPERGVETVRAFQLDQARVVLAWLEQRRAVP